MKQFSIIFHTWEKKFWTKMAHSLRNLSKIMKEEYITHLTMVCNFVSVSWKNESTLNALIMTHCFCVQCLMRQPLQMIFLCSLWKFWRNTKHQVMRKKTLIQRQIKRILVKVRSSGSKAMCSDLLICYVYAKKPYMSRNVLTLDKVGVKSKKQPKPTLQGIFELANTLLSG